MLSATVTRTGQVTIPNELRKTLGIHPGDRLSFSKKGHSIVIVLKKSNVAQSFGVLKAKKAASLKNVQNSIVAGATDD